MWRKIFDVLFWVSVSAYFGGMLVVGAVVAPTVFRTAEATGMSMPGIATPPLAADRQVGGEIFGAVLNRFAAVEVVALILLLVAILGWIASHPSVRRSTWVIAGLWACLLGLTVYDSYSIRSRVWQVRTQVRETAAAHVDYKEGMSGWPEKTEFDALHKRSELVGRLKAYLLLGMVVAAAWRGGADKKRNGGFRRMRVMTPVP
jgi:hypothetical protein